MVNIAKWVQIFFSLLSLTLLAKNVFQNKCIDCTTRRMTKMAPGNDSFE